MPHVTINQNDDPSHPMATDAPSVQIIKNANKTGTAKDARGRTFTFRRMTLLAKARLYAVAGPELSKNEQWIGLAAIAACVTQIDGDNMTSNSLREIEFLLEIMDDDGFEAVGNAYVKAFGVAVQEDAVANAKN